MLRFQGSFSAVLKPKFARKYSLEIFDLIFKSYSHSQFTSFAELIFRTSRANSFAIRMSDPSVPPAQSESCDVRCERY